MAAPPQLTGPQDAVFRQMPVSLETALPVSNPTHTPAFFSLGDICTDTKTRAAPTAGIKSKLNIGAEVELEVVVRGGPIIGLGL